MDKAGVCTIKPACETCGHSSKNSDDDEQLPIPIDSYLNRKVRIRTSDLQEAKNRKERWAMLTSYDYVSAKVFDKARIPCLLIGDSAAQTVYGYKSTLPITMEELIPLARAVTLGCERALVIADLPFGSYQESPEAALAAATRFMKESLVHGVKLEGGKDYAGHVKLLTRSGIPVMGHIGFTPQSEHSLSGFKVQGRGDEKAERLLNDALALEEAGAFACVLELIPGSVAKLISNRLHIPTIGIGAGPDCDAQILVWHDMAGFTSPSDKAVGYLSGVEEKESNYGTNSGCQGRKSTFELNKVPKFVKRYSNISEMLYKAAVQYSNEVQVNAYPTEEHSYI